MILIRPFIVMSVFVLLLACAKPASNVLSVGVIAGPEAELVKAAAPIARQHHVTLRVIEFTDYNLPNQALHDGSLDVNVYQHQPYLIAANNAHGFGLVAVGKTFLFPVGLYSTRYKSIDALPDHAIIAIPNDPSNEARALRLLEHAHLIQLTPDVSIPSLHDIKDNPRNLHFKQLDAAQLARVLVDVDAAVINTTFAQPAGLHLHDALLVEDKHSNYANCVVINPSNPKKAQIQQLVDALHSQAVTDRAQELFGEAAIPAW